MSGCLSAMGSGAAGRLLTVGVAVGGSTIYGFISGTLGALSPTEFLGSNLTQAKFVDGFLVVAIANTSQPNSGWSSVNINGNTFLRTSATYSAGAWTWSGVTNPMGTTDGAIIPMNIG